MLLVEVVQVHQVSVGTLAHQGSQASAACPASLGRLEVAAQVGPPVTQASAGIPVSRVIVDSLGTAARAVTAERVDSLELQVLAATRASTVPLGTQVSLVRQGSRAIAVLMVPLVTPVPAAGQAWPVQVGTLESQVVPEHPGILV